MITTRRNFLRTAAVGSASLVIGFDRLRLINAATAPAGASFQPSSWIRIDADGAVSLTIGKSEMGQGVRTSLAMLLADELDADWTRIRLVQAKPSKGSDLGTGGSDSIRSGWKTLRKAGASAREMLASAAAARWQVDRAACTTSDGAVLHTPTGRKISYGDLVGDAAKLPVPEDPPLKAIEAFKFIGKRTRRIDGQDIVTGKARYGIDVKVPDMLFASLERPPWAGAQVTLMHEERARAVRGVRKVLKLPGGGIAVVADSTWAAMKGRAALAAEWSEAPNDAF